MRGLLKRAYDSDVMSGIQILANPTERRCGWAICDRPQFFRAFTLRTVVHVVDDDASFRRAIDRLLRHCGYEVKLYESAEHLLAHLPSEAERCCVLLDVMIPARDFAGWFRASAGNCWLKSDKDRLLHQARNWDAFAVSVEQSFAAIAEARTLLGWVGTAL